MIEKLKHCDAVPYTQVSNAMLCDSTLSLKAKGLLSYMLSKPVDWQFGVRGIASEIAENKDTIAKIINELIERDYVTRIEIRESGRLKGYEYTVYHSPCPKKPDTVNSDTTNKDLQTNKEKGGSSTPIDTPREESKPESDTAPQPEPPLKSSESETTEPATPVAKPLTPDQKSLLLAKVEKRIQREIGIYELTDFKARAALTDFVERFGNQTTYQVLREYFEESKTADNIRRYFHKDIVERLTDASKRITEERERRQHDESARRRRAEEQEAANRDTTVAECPHCDGEYIVETDLGMCLNCSMERKRNTFTKTCSDDGPKMSPSTQTVLMSATS